MKVKYELTQTNRRIWSTWRAYYRPWRAYYRPLRRWHDNIKRCSGLFAVQVQKAIVGCRGMESDSPGIRVFAWSRSRWSLPFEVNSRLQASATPWLYIQPSITRFRPVYSSCRSWYLCLYTTVHLLLEEFRISLKSSLSTQSVCYTLSLEFESDSDFQPGVRVWVQVF